MSNIFFYRVCGTGMGPCAILLQESGHKVVGHDEEFYPPMSDFLKKSGIEITKEKITVEYLNTFDFVVVGNVVRKNSTDADIINKSSAKKVSFPQILGKMILQKKDVIGVIGTHGKTTTTYYLMQIMSKMDLNPGHFIGGILEDLPPARNSESKFFVIESDEYDSSYFHKESKFFSYFIKDCIFTSLEFDHADIFENFDVLKNNFKKFLDSLPGKIIYNSDYESISSILPKTKESLSYGLNSNFGPKNISYRENETSFMVSWEGHDYEFITSTFGEHNILNLSACILYLLSEGFSPSKINEAVCKLKNAMRRQEVKGVTERGTMFIDDFAHHPTAVKETLKSIKSKYPSKKIFPILYPGSATARSSLFQKEFTEILAEYEEVAIVRAQSETTIKGLDTIDSNKMVEEINKRGNKAQLINNKEDFLKIIHCVIEEKDDSWLVLTMSNSSMFNIWEEKSMQDLILKN